MPNRGLDWCDCGQSHELTRAIVYQHIIALGYGRANQLSHSQLVAVIIDVWHYAAVCRIFHLAVNEAAAHIHGAVAHSYPLGRSLDIVGYFSKTWQGCSDETCRAEGLLPDA